MQYEAREKDLAEDSATSSGRNFLRPARPLDNSHIFSWKLTLVPPR